MEDNDGAQRKLQKARRGEKSQWQGESSEERLPVKRRAVGKKVGQ